MVRKSSTSFRRHTSLPEGVDVAATNGSLDDGVLTVTVPLPQAETESQEITISSKKDTDGDADA